MGGYILTKVAIARFFAQHRPPWPVRGAGAGVASRCLSPAFPLAAQGSGCRVWSSQLTRGRSPGFDLGIGSCCTHRPSALLPRSIWPGIPVFPFAETLLTSIKMLGVKKHLCFCFLM